MTAVSELLFDRPATAADQIRRLLDKRSVALGLLGQGLPSVTAQVAEAVAGFLNMPVGGLVFHAWDKQQVIRNACAQTLGKPGALATVVVADHTLEITQRPTVHADIAGQQIAILDLVMSVALHIDSVTVTIQEGRVTRCGAGAASGAAELGVARPGGDSHPLVRRELARVSLQPYPPAPIGQPAG